MRLPFTMWLWNLRIQGLVHTERAVSAVLAWKLFGKCPHLFLSLKKNKSVSFTQWVHPWVLWSCVYACTSCHQPSLGPSLSSHILSEQGIHRIHTQNYTKFKTGVGMAFKNTTLEDGDFKASNGISHLVSNIYCYYKHTYMQRSPCFRDSAQSVKAH